MVSYFKKLGYQIVAFANGIHMVEMHHADLYLKPRWQLSHFQNALLNKTPWVPLMDRLESQFKFFSSNFQYGLQRERILYVFEHLGALEKKEDPKFVMAHVIAPHGPVVFNAEGGAVNPNMPFRWDFEPGLDPETAQSRFRGYVRYLNQLILDSIDRILKNSVDPPVIILISDHGGAPLSAYEDRTLYFHDYLCNLGAYYFPDQGSDALYADMTPVNIFRILFNHYFGTQLELLEDESYYSHEQYPYQFIKVDF